MVRSISAHRQEWHLRKRIGCKRFLFETGDIIRNLWSSRAGICTDVCVSKPVWAHGSVFFVFLFLFFPVLAGFLLFTSLRAAPKCFVSETQFTWGMWKVAVAKIHYTIWSGNMNLTQATETNCILDPKKTEICPRTFISKELISVIHKNQTVKVSEASDVHFTHNYITYTKNRQAKTNREQTEVYPLKPWFNGVRVYILAKLINFYQFRFSFQI